MITKYLHFIPKLLTSSSKYIYFKIKLKFH
jgi:hypothetical protein